MENTRVLMDDTVFLQVVALFCPSFRIGADHWICPVPAGKIICLER
ncbi:hypothetical protein OFAG_02131 [Oxalobacter formigenes HOxBLS]|uniref:Uncharacterized protein n=1 Tax=Oxalobacter paraformigenes TaxID=556268 RepID=T5LQT2_9BURK|nr:hypothetical protein [Oxalobacter paraformigenes]EQM95300.1 hypothetical protein OFAG_02131 [Oxalobacter paraformigenes]